MWRGRVQSLCVTVQLLDHPYLVQILPVAVAQLPPAKQAAGAKQEGVPAARHSKAGELGRGQAA